MKARAPRGSSRCGRNSSHLRAYHSGATITPGTYFGYANMDYVTY
jgi:hypothetical protein